MRHFCNVYRSYGSHLVATENKNDGYRGLTGSRKWSLIIYDVKLRPETYQSRRHRWDRRPLYIQYQDRRDWGPPRFAGWRRSSRCNPCEGRCSKRTGSDLFSRPENNVTSFIITPLLLFPKKLFQKWSLTFSTCHFCKNDFFDIFFHQKWKCCIWIEGKFKQNNRQSFGKNSLVESDSAFPSCSSPSSRSSIVGSRSLSCTRSRSARTRPAWKWILTLLKIILAEIRIYTYSKIV